MRGKLVEMLRRYEGGELQHIDVFDLTRQVWIISQKCFQTPFFYAMILYDNANGIKRYGLYADGHFS